MNKLSKYALAGAAFVAAAVGAPTSADALTTVYNPGRNGAYCVEAYAYVNGVVNGTSLNVVGYADASLWNNGGCNGAAAPENTVQMIARVWYLPPGETGNGFVVYDVPTNGTWQNNTYDLWGIYIATLENQSPLGGINIPDGNFYGDGYYRVEVIAQADNGGTWNQGSTFSAWQYAAFTY